MGAYAGSYKWIADKGATMSRVITWYSDEAQTTPVNLTNYTAKMQVRSVPGSTLILELSTTNGRIVLGGAAGTITCTVAAADMNMTADLYQYDLELTNGTVVTRLIQGSFEVRDEITT